MNAASLRLSPVQQRLLALVLLLAVIAVLASAVVVPVVLLHRHYDEAIAEAQDRVSRYRRIAAQAPEYRKALDGLRERDVRRFLLKNTAPNLAGAELQELVRAAVEGNGGRINTSQNQPPREDGRFRQITVSLQFFATTANLQRILYAIESHQPYLLVENLTLRPVNAFRGYRPAPGAEPEINVQVEVSAFVLNEPEKPASAPGTAVSRPTPGAT